MPLNAVVHHRLESAGCQDNPCAYIYYAAEVFLGIPVEMHSTIDNKDKATRGASACAARAPSTFDVRR
jgi:hypothetical protein